MSQSRSLKAVRAIVAASLLAALFFPRLHPRPMTVTYRSNVDQGESLIHGIPLRLDFKKMPMPSVLAALLFSHGKISPEAWERVKFWAEALMILALGGLLRPGGMFLGFGALGLHLWASRDGAAAGSFEPVTLQFLLIAGLLVWRELDRSLRRTSVLALAVGSSLLLRSTFFFFPPFLALAEWFSWGRDSARSWAKHALILCAVPYLFLIPWVRMNRVLYHETVALERGIIAPGIVTGVLGLDAMPPAVAPQAILERLCLNASPSLEACVRRPERSSLDSLRRPLSYIGTTGAFETADGAWSSLVDESLDGRRPAAMLVWAFGEIVRHPARFLATAARRVRFVILLHPIVFCLALAGLWVQRASPAFRRLGLLAGFFGVSYCAVPAVARMFEPLWPLLSILAASLVLRFAPKAEPRLEARVHAFSAGVMKGGFALALALGLYTLRTVDSYASIMRRQPAVGTALDEALAIKPEDSWLWSERAKSSLTAGDVSSAIRDFSRAAEFDPTNKRYELMLAWSRMLQGDGAPLEGFSPPAPGDIESMRLIIETYILKAHGCLLSGRLARAREHIRSAVDRSREFSAREEAELKKGSWIIGRGRPDDDFLAVSLDSLLSERPAAERMAFVDELAALEPGWGHVWTERAVLALKAGRRDKALQSLARAERLNPAAADARRIASLYGDLAAYPRALALLAPFLRSASGDPGLWLEHAELSAKAGDRRSALESLARAESLHPTERDLRRAAALYRDLKEYRRASIPLEALLESAPRDAGLWVDLAETALKAGDRDAALAALSRAEALRPAAEDLRRIASAYDAMLEERRALASLDPLIKGSSPDAGLWLARAELASKAGDRRSVLESLASAEALKPGTGELRRIAALYRESEEYRRALAPLEALVKAEPEDAGLWLERAAMSLKAGQRDMALASLARAEALKPGTGDLRRIASLYGDSREYRRALASLEALVKAEPEDEGLWLERAEISLKAGQRAPALESLARAEALKTETGDLRRIASMYRASKEYRRALAPLEALIKREPRDAALRIEYADLALAAGERGASALESLARAEALNPRARDLRRIASMYRELKENRRALAPLEALIKREPGDAALRIEYAELAATAGEPGSALESLARAEGLNPGPGDLRRIASMYRESKEYRRALAPLDALVKAEPKDAGLWLERAEMSLKAGRRDSALESLARAEALKPGAGDLRRISSMYGDLKEYRRALIPLESLLKAASGDPGLWFARAELSLKTGERRKALESLSAAEALKPDAEQWHGIALLYDELGEGARALRILERLTREHPSAAVYFSDLGLCRYRQGLIESSIKDLKQAIRMEPGLMPAYLTLGSIYTETKRDDDALTLYDAALALKPAESDEPLRKIIVSSRAELLARRHRP